MPVIKQLVAEQKDNLRATRRYLHRHPELSGEEHNTLALIKARMEKCGLPLVFQADKQGLVAKLTGPAGGRVLAFRADMDALPLTDMKDVPYASGNPGVMHACGHDGHTAILLSLAEVLSAHPELAQGDVYFIFQQHEERPPGGAKGIAESGVLDEVDAVYGLHLWTFIPYGEVGICPDKCMAASDAFKIELIGRGGHGAAPHKAVDAVVLGAHVVQALQYVLSRFTDPLEPAVLSIGKFNSGSNFNIIAETAVLEGITRHFDQETRELIRERIEQTVAGACRIFGADYNCAYEMGFPAVINYPREVERVVEAVGQIDAAKAVTMPPQMISEDFSYFLQRNQGCFFLVGAANEEQGIIYPLHHPRFDLDERSLEIGLEIFLRLCRQ